MVDDDKTSHWLRAARSERHLHQQCEDPRYVIVVHLQQLSNLHLIEFSFYRLL